jgi:hypothetical protein
MNKTGFASVALTLLMLAPTAAAELPLDLQLRLGPAFDFGAERDVTSPGFSGAASLTLHPRHGLALGVSYDYARIGWQWTDATGAVLDERSYIEQHFLSLAGRLYPLRSREIEPYAGLQLGRVWQRAGHSGDHCSDPSPGFAVGTGAGVDVRLTRSTRVGGDVFAVPLNTSTTDCDAVRDPDERYGPPFARYVAARVGVTIRLR